MIRASSKKSVTFVAAAGLFLLGLLTWAPAPAAAWETLRCTSNPSVPPNFGGDGTPWPLRFMASPLNDSETRAEFRAAASEWNGMVGARDVFSVRSDDFAGCGPDMGQPYGIMTMDDGTCMEWADQSWGPNTLGIRLLWQAACSVTRSVVYLNSNRSWTGTKIRHTTMHELGHYGHYAHNWYQVSIMGYGGTEMTFLSAKDHEYLRSIYEESGSAAPDLHIHRYVLLTTLGREIVPDEHSLTRAPAPTCTPSCQQLTTGSEITATLTYGNTGAAATGRDFRIAMMLGEHEIASFRVAPLEAHTSLSYEFTGVVPAGIPGGDHELRMVIDPDDVIAETEGPSSGNEMTYPGFRVACISSCGGRQCGDDGCGGSCGTCEGEQDDCREGACVCLPLCEGLPNCAPDGCGGRCGDCNPGSPPGTAPGTMPGATPGTALDPSPGLVSGCGCRIGGPTASDRRPTNAAAWLVLLGTSLALARARRARI